MSQWAHEYCPHQAFNQSLKERLRSIPYSIFPDPTIDAFSNLNIKSANLKKSNITTLAYQHYMCPVNQQDTQRNFVKDYYLENDGSSSTKLDNDIVNEEKKRMAEGSAYVLATGASKDYSQFETNRQNTIKTARRRAQSAIHAFYHEKQSVQTDNKAANLLWLARMNRRLEEFAKHFVYRGGEDPSERERLFLKTKMDLTVKSLTSVKVNNPQKMVTMLTDLRVLMQKAKIGLSDKKEEQERNKSISMSYTSQASQNTSQGSMTSEATSANESIDRAEENMKKYCDFEALKKKWNAKDIDKVKELLRMSITRQCILDAELEAVKHRQRESLLKAHLQSDSKHKKSDSKHKKSDSKNKKSEPKNKKSEPKNKKNRSKSTVEQQEYSVKEKKLLTKEEQSARDQIANGGKFDAVGERILRNRNYATVFTKRERSMRVAFATTNPPNKIDSLPITTFDPKAIPQSKAVPHAPCSQVDNLPKNGSRPKNIPQDKAVPHTPSKTLSTTVNLTVR